MTKKQLPLNKKHLIILSIFYIIGLAVTRILIEIDFFSISQTVATRIAALALISAVISFAVYTQTKRKIDFMLALVHSISLVSTSLHMNTLNGVLPFLGTLTIITLIIIAVLVYSLRAIAPKTTIALSLGLLVISIIISLIASYSLHIVA